MENTNTQNDTCDSPVYVGTTPISSPVSSPVIISKGSNHEWNAQVTDKLILPELNESDIIGVPEAHHHSTPSSVPSSVNNTPSSANATPVTVTPNDVNVTSDGRDGRDGQHGKEMVTIIVKDFAYCKEEFLRNIKENNVSVSPETIMRLLRMAMVIVEKTNETGSKKKEFVLNLLTEVVMTNDMMILQHKQEALHLIKGGVVSDAIDFLIDATRGKFDVNKVEKIAEEVAKSCFTLCFEKFMKKK
jgi:hypothetical protein